ncbi:ABC transporter permease [Saccharomonospora sp. NPDC046836]|uniref:ABC transporter permease n=1 Tax=Saccharomonospora sp. NPDC046836 TaxID=3156921 RepID=UPI0033DB93D0
MVELKKPALGSTLVSGHPEPDGTTQASQRRSMALTVALRLIAAGPLLVLLCIWLVFSLLSPYFLSTSNVTNILVQSSSVALLALGALVVVMVGSLDLSLGSTVGLCTIVGAVIFRDYPSLGWFVIPLLLLIGLAIGIVNALCIVSLRIGNAFIVTLGMLYVIQSLSYVVSGGTQVPGVPNHVIALANESLFGIPGPVLLVIACGGLLWLLLNRVAWGRWIVAIGGNRDAASKVGIPTRKVLFSVYIIASVFAAVTGILVAGLNNSGTVDNGTSILQAIAAVVIGGASLTGGRGSVWYTVVGAVILGSITNGLTLLSVSPNWTPFAIGAVLVAAVGLDTLRTSVEGKLRIRQAQIQAGGAV